jgi:hypothetical protein
MLGLEGKMDLLALNYTKGLLSGVKKENKVSANDAKKNQQDLVSMVIWFLYPKGLCNSLTF